MTKEDSPLYYRVEGDPRLHFDNKKAEELRATVPQYWEDTCPECENKEGIQGCRCFLSHRLCSKCGTGWRWELDKINAKMVIILDKG